MRDLLVVGGGPAGLAVAIEAAQAGMRVAVCERWPGSLDKACGEGLMPGAVRALAALGVSPPGRDIIGIAYSAPGHSVHARFPDEPGRGVRRTVLHEALHTTAVAAGVEFQPGRVERIDQGEDHVEAAGLRARYLVAADGLHSPIRRALGLDLPSRAPLRWGLRRHYSLAPSSPYVQVRWAASSESYVTPVASDTVGVAVLSSVRAPFGQQLREFPELHEWLADATAVSAVRGAGPLRQRVRARVAGRVLLVGDAAGYVDALTGEGIAISLAAAHELVSCLVQDRPERYERAWLRVSRRSRMITSGLLWARHQPILARAVVPAAARAPRIFAAAVGQLAG
jgi:flavin-dependent dehydrogenase